MRWSWPAWLRWPPFWRAGGCCAGWLGVLLAAIGAGLAVSAFTLSAAGAESAVSSAVSPETAAAGSVMDGSGTATNTAPDVAGTATHVLFSAAGWQALVVTGALLMIAAGPAGRLAGQPDGRDVQPVRRSRPWQRPGRDAAPAGLAPQPAAASAADSASIWEALSRGDDPTAAGSRA